MGLYNWQWPSSWLGLLQCVAMTLLRALRDSCILMSVVTADTPTLFTFRVHFALSTNSLPLFLCCPSLYCFSPSSFSVVPSFFRLSPISVSFYSIFARSYCKTKLQGPVAYKISTISTRNVHRQRTTLYHYTSANTHTHTHTYTLSSMTLHEQSGS